jgi:hypothetical protein
MTWAEENTVGIHYQATNAEDWEDLVHAIVFVCKVCELAIAF